jgi:hypothetical protein
VISQKAGNKVQATVFARQTRLFLRLKDAPLPAKSPTIGIENGCP